MPLTIPEAIRGAEVEVPTLDGRKKLRVPRRAPSTARSSACAARDRRARSAGPGDIRYRFVIDVPETLSAEQSEAVEKLSAFRAATRGRGCSHEDAPHAHHDRHGQLATAASS